MCPCTTIPAYGDDSSVVQRLKCHSSRLSSAAGAAANLGLGLSMSSRRSYWILLIVVKVAEIGFSDSTRVEASGEELHESLVERL
jgi:hypothetical protein